MDNPNLLSSALFSTELWWRMNHRRSFRTFRLKSPDSWNFSSEFWVLGTFSSNVKINLVISWNGHNLFYRIFPSNSQDFAIPLVVFHDRRESLGALHDTFHESTPQPRGKNTVKRNSERRIPRKSSENRRLFPGAILVLRPSLLGRNKETQPRKKENSRTLLIGFSPEWGGTTRLGYTDVLVVREIDCGNWLAREYSAVHQHCGLIYPLVWGLA